MSPDDGAMSRNDKVPTLSQGGVRLRAVTAADVPGLRRLAADPGTEDWRDDARLRWAITPAPEVDGGALLGTIALHDEVPGVCGLTRAIEPGARNRGVCSAATRLVVDWALSSGQAQTITWRARAGNTAAWRVAWKNGFTFEATSRSSLIHRGGLDDAWHASLLKSDTREPKTRWLSPVRIDRPGVVLRDLSPDDEQGFLETTNDPLSHHWLGTVGLPQTPEAFRTMERRHHLPGSLGTSVQWALADPETDAYLGSINVFGLDTLDFNSAEVGYRAHPAARGRGLLTRALRAVLEHAFAPADKGGLGLGRISLGAGDGNLGSQAVARSCGFTETGRDRRSYDRPDGSVVDLIRFDLLASELPGALRDRRDPPLEEEPP